MAVENRDVKYFKKVICFENFNDEDYCVLFEMDSKICGLKSKMIHYCLNKMRKRTVDEQLYDFAEILDTPLELKITYEKTEVKVCYEIGPHSASVEGSHESACIWQCKLNVLHELRAFCNFAKDPAKEFHRRQSIGCDVNDDFGRMLDVYSEIQLNKIDQCEFEEKTHEIGLNQAKLIDRPEYDVMELKTVQKLAEPLILHISYRKTEIRVTCKIGLHDVSVVGLTESTCIRQAKSEIIDRIRIDEQMARERVQDALSTREDNGQRSDHKDNCGDDPVSEVVGQSPETPPENPMDLEKLSETSDSPNGPVTVHFTRNDTNETVIAKDEIIARCSEESNDTTDYTMIPGPSYYQPSSTAAGVTRNDIINALKVQMDITDGLGLAVESPRAPAGSTEDLTTVPPRARYPESTAEVDRVRDYLDFMQNEMDDMSNESRLRVIEARLQTPDKTVTDFDRTTPESRDQQPVTGESGTMRVAIPTGPSKRLFESVAAVMDNLTKDTLSTSAEVFLGILVKASRADLGRIMDFVLQKAIYELDYSGLYADLCSKANKMAQEDASDGVRSEFPNVFKGELLKACNKVLRAAGVLPEIVRHGSGARSDERVRPPRNTGTFDADERVRTLGTCRFMGDIFMLNSFKVFNATLRNVNAFVKARDAHSLECLCVLLTVIGPRFERIDESTIEIPPMQIYATLNKLSIRAQVDKSLPARTVYMIDQLLNVRSNWTSRLPPPQTDVFNEWPDLINTAKTTRHSGGVFASRHLSGDRRLRSRPAGDRIANTAGPSEENRSTE